MCNRSFFPCFDTPAVKSPYTATVRVSRQLDPHGPTVGPDRERYRTDTQTAYRAITHFCLCRFQME